MQKEEESGNKICVVNVVAQQEWNQRSVLAAFIILCVGPKDLDEEKNKHLVAKFNICVMLYQPVERSCWYND